jgi:hypothetical protein
MRFLFYDVVVEVVTTGKVLNEYLEKIYGGFKVAPEGGRDADIVVKISWENKLSNFKHKILGLEEHDWKRVDAQTYIGRDACFYNDKIEKRNTQIFFLERDGKFFFEIVRQEKWLTDILRKDRESQLTRWVSYFVCYPLFFYLERFRQMHPLHAGLTVFQGKNVLIMGLANMGKTSLSLEMARRGNTLLLSDNLSFYNDKQIFPCYEPIKIRKEEKSIDQGLFQLVLETRLRKYCLSKTFDPGGRTPQVLILPCFSAAPFVKELSPQEAALFVMNANVLVCEIKNYFSCANMWNFALAGNSLQVVREDCFGKFISRCRCYQLGIGARETIPQTTDRIQQLLER